MTDTECEQGVVNIQQTGEQKIGRQFEGLRGDFNVGHGRDRLDIGHGGHHVGERVEEETINCREVEGEQRASHSLTLDNQNCSVKPKYKIFRNGCVI